MSNDNAGRGNIGWHNVGDNNLGDRNLGSRNVGFGNIGVDNSGDLNVGSANTGHWNSGCRNSGHFNVGDFNSGCWNYGDRHTGFFNTEMTPKIKFFDKETNLTMEEIKESELLRIMEDITPPLTSWVDAKDMTEKEKENYPQYKATGGYLRHNDIKKEYVKNWNNLTEWKKDAIKGLPNFDADKFYLITGIDIKKEEDRRGEIAKVLDEYAKKNNMDRSELYKIIRETYIYHYDNE